MLVDELLEDATPLPPVPELELDELDPLPLDPELEELELLPPQLSPQMEPTSPTHAASQRFWQQYESEAQSLVTQGSQPDSRALPWLQIACVQGGAPPVPEDELAALADVLLLDAATDTVTKLPPVDDEPPVLPPMPPVDEEPPVGLPPVPEDELDAFPVAPPVEEDALLALPPVPEDELAAFAAAWFEESMSLPPVLWDEQPASPDTSRAISPRHTVNVARISVLSGTKR